VELLLELLLLEDVLPSDSEEELLTSVALIQEYCLSVPSTKV